MSWRKSTDVECNLLVWKDFEERTFVTLILLISEIWGLGRLITFFLSLFLNVVFLLNLS